MRLLWYGQVLIDVGTWWNYLGWFCAYTAIRVQTVRAIPVNQIKLNMAGFNCVCMSHLCALYGIYAEILEHEDDDVMTLGRFPHCLPFVTSRSHRPPEILFWYFLSLLTWRIRWTNNWIVGNLKHHDADVTSLWCWFNCKDNTRPFTNLYQNFMLDAWNIYYNLNSFSPSWRGSVCTSYLSFIIYHFIFVIFIIFPPNPRQVAANEV